MVQNMERKLLKVRKLVPGSCKLQSLKAVCPQLSRRCSMPREHVLLTLNNPLVDRDSDRLNE